MGGIGFRFFDVGMGDGTLVSMPSGEFILVDFGENGTQFKVPIEDAVKSLASVLEEYAPKDMDENPVLEILFLSHGDVDHYSALPRIIEHIKQKYDKKLIINKIIYGGKKNDYGGTIEYLENFSQAQVIGDFGGFLLKFGGSGPLPLYEFGSGQQKSEIYLLSANLPIGGKNEDSLVLMFKYHDFKVILPGDATCTVEAWILKHLEDNNQLGFLKSDVLKLGHHGSKGSSSEEWLKYVEPMLVFASGDIKWQHPYCEAIDRCHKVRDDLKPEHRYSCGNDVKPSAAGFDYNNHGPTMKGVYLNLWYTVPPGKTERLTYGDLQGDFSGGTTFGVEWLLEVDEKGDFWLNYTGGTKNVGATRGNP
jgi:competence protein ComEC